MIKYVLDKAASTGKIPVYKAVEVPDIKEDKPVHPSLNRTPSEKKMVWLELRAY